LPESLDGADPLVFVLNPLDLSPGVVAGMPLYKNDLGAGSHLWQLLHTAADVARLVAGWDHHCARRLLLKGGIPGGIGLGAGDRVFR